MASSAISELLLSGEDDWIQFCEVLWVVRSTEGLAADDPGLRPRVLGVLRELIAAGWMEAGEFDGRTFVSWRLAPEAALAEIARRWAQLREAPGLGDVCWLANTAAGDAQAALLRQQQTACRNHLG